MDISLKVTDEPRESTFFDLVSGDSVLSIPLFQRPYRWSSKNLDWLFDDIDDIITGVTKSCFLGVVVCVMRGATPGRPIPWEIVDGQQRLSTLYLILLAAAELHARKGEKARAAAIIGTYLLVRPLAENSVNTKLVPSFHDSTQFKLIWDELMSVAGLGDEPSVSANPPRPPSPGGGDSGAMSKQYGRIRRELGSIWQERGADGVDRVVEVVANKLSVVSISLRDPSVAPKIFERLNNRAELVTVADLVRNEVFSRSKGDATHAAHVFANYWEPFATQFAGIDDGLGKFLFPYALISNKAITKGEVFSHLRLRWEQLQDPKHIIDDMQEHVPTFLALEAHRPVVGVSAALQERLSRLNRIGKPSSIFAFVMRLIQAVRKQEVADAVAVEVCDVVESFLFRRAVCGIEPTGLHAVFKGMWADLTDGDGAPGVSAASVSTVISGKPTVSWPTDKEFGDAVRDGSLYGRKVAHYAIEEHERSRRGESPRDDFQIEHILPQTSTPEWDAVFAPKVRETFVDQWANLIPLTRRMNPALGQLTFDGKRAEYKESIFAAAREVAASYDAWGPEEARSRSRALVTWAMTRWATGRAQAAGRQAGDAESKSPSEAS